MSERLSCRVVVHVNTYGAQYEEEKEQEEEDEG